MTAALWKTTLPQASLVAPLSGVDPAATLMNQPALGMRSIPGPPLGLDGAVRRVVLVPLPSGPAVTGESVKVGGEKITLKSKPVVGAGAPQTPRRICTACTLPGSIPERATLTAIVGAGELPTPLPTRSARPSASEPLTAPSSTLARSGGLVPRAA